VYPTLLNGSADCQAAVGSMKILAERLGDKEWRSLLDRHHALVRQELVRFRGQEIDTAGDGFFATFDGPARGVRCAFHDPEKYWFPEPSKTWCSGRGCRSARPASTL